MKFLFLLARRTPPVPSQIIIDVGRILATRGHQVNSVIAEENLCSLHDLQPKHDLYLLKSYTELSLSLAGALSVQGAPLINSYAGCAAARNKIVCNEVLKQAGVPVPRSWITADLTLLRTLVQQHPLILKPYMGWRGEGVRVVRNESELAQVSLGQSPLLIQEYIENSGEDLRLYVAGDEVFGIRKRFSSTSFAADGEPVVVSSQLRDLALRCGRAFNLRLYGIDIIEGEDGPRVVDVNYFPGYKGIRDARFVVADFIEQYARRSLQPEYRPMRSQEVAGA